MIGAVTELCGGLAIVVGFKTRAAALVMIASNSAVYCGEVRGNQGEHTEAIGSPDFCPRTAWGNNTAAPPSSVMKSRR